mgnify:CR=1 FL=1
MNRIDLCFLIILVSFPLVSEAGRILDISVDNAMITIRHSGCQLKPLLKEKRTLILPMGNCASRRGKINVSHPHLTKVTRIHWAQHDPQTVWIVVTFSTEYQFEITSSLDQYLVCLPSCEPKNQANRLSQIRKTKKMMFLLDDIFFQIPLQGMLIDEFLERSIGFIPEDMVRDGLPHFGSKRDDWKGNPRMHQGYDIYADKINVIAAADGTVIKIGRTYSAGLYVKLHHGSWLYTVYVHLKSASVTTGQQVRQGDIIGRIDGPTGNAVAPQLHFEIKPSNRSIDPLPLIEHFYQDDKQTMDKIKNDKESLSEASRYRERAVQQFLNSPTTSRTMD